MSDPRPRPARHLPSLLAVVVTGVVLVLTASGGAVAGSLITGAQIKNGSLTGIDVKDRSLTTADLAATTRQRLRGPRGAAGATGAPGAPGLVRGWAQVSDDGTRLASSPGVTVQHLGDPGRYCVSVPGVDPRQSAPVVTLNFDGDTTQSGAVNGRQAVAEVADGGFSCSGGALLVRTWQRTFTTTDGGTRLASTFLEPQDQAFNVLVP